MPIEFIDNQTVSFRSEEDTTDCGCKGQKFCQPVTISDETNFQLLGNVLNANPAFTDSLDGWEQWVGIILTNDYTGISAVGECDGIITSTSTGGSGTYGYSIDGGSFGPSGSFTGLCAGTYLITVRDSEGHYSSGYVTIQVQYDCTSLNGSDANDVLAIIDYDISQCFAHDLI